MPNQAYFPASEADRVVWPTLFPRQASRPRRRARTFQRGGCQYMVKPWFNEHPLLNASAPEIRKYRLR